jgi:hypothetical protein
MTLEAVILTYAKKPLEQLEAVRKTWAKDVDYVMLGDPSQQGGDIISYPEVPENNYDYLWIKYLAFIKRNEFTKDWYFFCDDDTFVNVKNLKTVLEKYDPTQNVCIGSKCILNKDGTDRFGTPTGFLMETIKGKDVSLPLTHPSGGSGFALSKKTLQLLKEYLKGNKDIGYCYKVDAALAFWLTKINTELIHVDEFYGNVPGHFNHTEEDIKKNITYHYIKQEQMYDLYKLCC